VEGARDRSAVPRQVKLTNGLERARGSFKVRWPSSLTLSAARSGWQTRSLRFDGSVGGTTDRYHQHWDPSGTSLLFVEGTEVLSCLPGFHTPALTGLCAISFLPPSRRGLVIFALHYSRLTSATTPQLCSSALCSDGLHFQQTPSATPQPSCFVPPTPSRIFLSLA
jgi:hypothetical protein